MTIQHQLEVLRPSINLKKILKNYLSSQNNKQVLCLCNLLKYSVVRPVCVCTCCLANNYHVLVILSAAFLSYVSFYVFVISSAFLFL